MENTILNGIRVLDLTNECGAYCTRLLAQFGAEVIRIEPLEGDRMRHLAPFAKQDEGVENSLIHAFYNEGKKSITLDYTTKKGQEIFYKLVQTADVLVESFKPGTMKDWGFDYETLKGINPGLIMCSITPFGQTGPYAQWNSSSELIPFAMMGPMFENGIPEREPLQVGWNAAADGTAVCALTGILALLFARGEEQVGDYLDISVFEVVGSWRNLALGRVQMPPKYAAEQRSGSQGVFVPANYYKCKDGYVSMMASGKWTNLVTWMKEVGMDVGDKEDPKYLPGAGFNKYLWADVDNVNRMVSELCSKYTKLEMMEESQRRGIPVGMSETADTILANPHFKAREMFRQVDHPVIGSYMTTASQFHYDGPEMKVGVRAPFLGEHNDGIYKKLGLSDVAVKALHAESII